MRGKLNSWRLGMIDKTTFTIQKFIDDEDSLKEIKFEISKTFREHEFPCEEE